jgi:hypothetical protein
MNYEQLINEFYQNYLGRAPDEEGRKGYLAQMQGGRNPYEIAYEIQGSDEGRAYKARQAFDNQRAIDVANTKARDIQAKYDLAAGERDKLQERIGGYESRIKGFEDDIEDYKERQIQLAGQYQTALGQVQDWTSKANEYQRAASDWENQFQSKSAEYQAARQEAERYRNEAVGRQLAGLRSGSTIGGSNAGGAGRGSLASGGTGYRSADDKAVQIEKNIQAESGALSRKGPVVERIARAEPRRAASSGGGQAPPTQSSSYYASRFR